MNPRAIKKVLVPVDFSSGSRAAMNLAVTMAKAFNAGLELFHVWQPPPFVTAPIFVMVPEGKGGPLALDDVARQHADAELKKLVDDMRRAGVTDVHAGVGIGSPAHEIVELAAREHYDLIIMGTHGRTGLAHALIGSVAEKVVRRAACPVMTVRSREEGDKQ